MKETTALHLLRSDSIYGMEELPVDLSTQKIMQKIPQA